MRYFCAAVFLLFTFCYLYCMEGDLLAQAQFVFSHGKTTYSILVGAIIITAVLQVLQWLMSLVLHVPSRWHALTYVPSFVALTMLTHLDARAINHFAFGAWTWLLPLLLLIYLAIIYAIHAARRSRRKAQKVHADENNPLLPNAMTMLLFILLCGGTNAASDVYMFELKTERLILQQRYADALRVGLRSLPSTARLTNLRMYALSLEDSLSERLFDYPQSFGTAGLLQLSDTSRSQHRITADRIVRSLGVAPDSIDAQTPEQLFAYVLQHHVALADSLQHIDSTAIVQPTPFWQIIIDRPQFIHRQLRRAADYYLCSHLLRRDLMAFIDDFGQYEYLYVDTLSVRPLPRAFREALAVVSPDMADSLTLQHHADYITMRDTLADPIQRTNLTRRRFGNTLWWYLDNPDD